MSKLTVKRLKICFGSIRLLLDKTLRKKVLLFKGGESAVLGRNKENSPISHHIQKRSYLNPLVIEKEFYFRVLTS